MLYFNDINVHNHTAIILIRNSITESHKNVSTCQSGFGIAMLFRHLSGLKLQHQWQSCSLSCFLTSNLAVEKKRLHAINKKQLETRTQSKVIFKFSKWQTHL
jgi:hypothetical protein